MSSAVKSSVFKSLVGLPSSYQSIASNGASVPEGASAFVTYDRRGRRVKNGQYTDAEPLKWTTTNGKTGSQKATIITYSFKRDFGLNGLSASEVKDIFRQALLVWANHAPIEFVEVKDPGADNLVDIRVGDEFVDGKGNTLAFAFFPTGGEITFDNGEVWTSDKYRETAVHEIGHALGLDHEDDVQAIMNSVLRNRFDNGNAFLLPDDIAGIQNLYGKGKGSVTALNGSKTPANPPASPEPPPLVNLITNGSFESVASLADGESRAYKRIQGWTTLSGIGFQVDRSVDAADGTAAVNLDPFATNSTIYQNVKTKTGDRYTLSLAFNDSGETQDDAGIAVFWEGEKIDEIRGNGSGQWRRFDYVVEGGNRNVSTLAFRAIGNPNPKAGTVPGVLDPTAVYVDDVVVTAAEAASSASLRSANLWSANLLWPKAQALSQKHTAGIGEETNSYRDPVTGERTGFGANSAMFSFFPLKQIQSGQRFV